METEKYDYEYKIIFLGSCGIGAKTSLINRIVDNTFNYWTQSTSDANYSSIFFQTELGIIKLNLWDTSGQEKYRALTKIFIKDCHCIILGYDITSQDSFNDIKKFWYNET